ncbi:gp53-like domain-containing protein [Megamonas funiformis]|uniref:gp53-like domain-containing protein n=1 Tax=Megamonas funiformis TaxID=437897 RepID=UPI003F85A0FA
MNSEELKKNFSLLMPSEINGFKRPKEPIANDNDFFLEVPQLIQKDPVLYSTMNLILGVLVSNDKLLKQWHDTLQNVVNAQDWRVVTDSLKGYMTPELKKKLDGIAAGANNYIHPSTHSASMITQDTTHRFVTDTEKTTWNGKASTAVVSTTANGLMPKRDGSATSIFTGDGVWKSLAWNLITGKPSTFAPSAHNHDGSYLKLSGGSLTGALNLANGIWNKIGDDVYIGDSNQAGCLCIKGVNADSGIAFVNKDNTVQIAKLTYAGGNLISSAKIQANLAGTADKATNDSSNRNIVNTYATKASPAFSGTPTSPTPATSDNSTKIATTEFVRNLINQFKTDGTLGGIIGGSLTQNGWVKFSNGLILQWGFRSDTGYGGRAVTFPIAFTKQCFNGHVTTKRGGDSANGNNYVDNLTTTNMWTVCDGGGGYWIAIGY